MTNHKYIAFIPARGGSKGIPGKNIRKIHGKALIAWSIEHALSCKKISDVYVSTDSKEIQEVALKHGAKVPFLRPDGISGDKASTESAVMHFIDWCGNNKVVFDNLILLQATSPFRHIRSVQKAIEKFEDEKADSLLTVVKSHKFIWNNIQSPIASYDFMKRPRRQDIKEKDQQYFENGSFYITKSEIYKKNSNRLGGNVSMFEMTPEESHEIDDLIDFEITEMLMKKFGDKNDSK
jgi:N-acylneuraminate cytidylyltransferase